jgi:ABC-2 type transport system permease protein
MTRYIRTIWLFVITSLAAEMEYRVNFFVAVLNSVGNVAGSLFALSLFYKGDYGFGGWPWEAALMIIGVFTVLQGITATILTPNLSRLVQYVQDGTLDFVLLKPVDSQFFVSTRSTSPWGLPDILLGVGIIVYAGVELGVAAESFLLGILPLMLGIGILYSLWFILATLSIWFVKIYNVTEVLRGLLDAGRFPIRAYPAGYRFFFTFIVPVAFLTSVPVETMMGEAHPSWLLGSAITATVLFVCSRLFWRFALRHYTSASS